MRDRVESQSGEQFELTWLRIERQCCLDASAQTSLSSSLLTASLFMLTKYMFACHSSVPFCTSMLKSNFWLLLHPVRSPIKDGPLIERHPPVSVIRRLRPGV